jgi:hypothetical protein
VPFRRRLLAMHLARERAVRSPESVPFYESNGYDRISVIFERRVHEWMQDVMDRTIGR